MKVLEAASVLKLDLPDSVVVVATTFGQDFAPTWAAFT
jgi:hypothetical protein